MAPAANTNTNTDANAANRAKRAERDRLEGQIVTTLLELEQQVFDTLKAVSEKLDVELADLRARFLAQVAARQYSKVTAWNGLVHEMSIEWAYLKADFPGTAFVNEVSRRISESGMYKKLTEEEKTKYEKVAQSVRDTRLTAGTAKSGEQRLGQGTAKKLLMEMATRLDWIHEVTGIESTLIAVRGHSTDGLQPVIYSSPKARQCVETHLKFSISTLVQYLEKSVTHGAMGMVNAYKNDTQSVKGSLRAAMTESLRNAATSTADDGSLPLLDDPARIASISWRHYWSLVVKYHVKAFNWPTHDDGSLKDPSDVGGPDKMTKLLDDINKGKCGFRRLTDNAWQELMDQRNVLVEEGVVQPAIRKVRSDKGKVRKQKQVLEEATEPAKKKAKRAGTTNNVPAATATPSTAALPPSLPALTTASTVPSLPLSNTTSLGSPHSLSSHASPISRNQPLLSAGDVDMLSYPDDSDTPTQFDAPEPFGAAGFSGDPSIFTPSTQSFALSTPSFTPSTPSFTPSTPSFAPSTPSFTPSSTVFTPLVPSFTQSAALFTHDNFPHLTNATGYWDTPAPFDTYNRTGGDEASVQPQRVFAQNAPQSPPSFPLHSWVPSPTTSGQNTPHPVRSTTATPRRRRQSTPATPRRQKDPFRISTPESFPTESRQRRAQRSQSSVGASPLLPPATQPPVGSINAGNRLGTTNVIRHSEFASPSSL